LTEDYIALYKENALLKSKMRVLVSKLEEYRKNEASMKEAMAEAQQACDDMVREAEERCSRMLSDANAAAAENAKYADAMIAAEDQRVDDARRLAAAKIDELEFQLRSCIDTLERIKSANRPSQSRATAFDFDKHEPAAHAVADEISRNLEEQVGVTEDEAPKAEPMHPKSDTTTKFANLQFGRNYDPHNK
jgi:cell division initiation protein